MSIVQRFRPLIPRRLRPVLRYYYAQSQIAQASIADMLRNLQPDDVPLPPAHLRYRVHGAADARTFLEAGRRCADNINDALGHVSRDLSSFTQVLDFGCGCGRILRYFRSCEGPRFHGVDIDPQAIEWCRRALPFGQFEYTATRPPLPFADETFDFIYGISVLTHLDEEFQFDWLGELRRVARPGALVLLTLHGDLATSGLSEEELEVTRLKGFFFKVFQTGRFKLDGLPDFYQCAFHTEEYVRRIWSNYFTICAYLPRAMNGHQDIVLLQR